ncbi:MAG: NAD(P)H-hydrate dehydratase [Lachnospiraceae bacterium]|nr:NAD(P)H-hydrate dehydratase [Lachnospiraceae bacterium]
MKYLLTSREMKQADHNTIEHFHMPDMVLMERAALGVVEVIENEDVRNKTIGVVCGAGNNGGDGFAVARLLYLKGYSVILCFVGDENKMTEQCRAQRDICQQYEIPISCDVHDIEMCHVVVDAIFGVGLSREITGTYTEIISYMNGLNAKKIAVDMPSGICADDGRVLGCAFKADCTITFAFGKVGQRIYPGREYCGRIVLVDIGIAECAFGTNKPQYMMLEEGDLDTLPFAPVDANKGSMGKVLLIAGSEEMAGAAYLAAHSAMVTGCGLVKVYTPRQNRDIILSRLPEALLVCYDKFDEKECISLMQWADVVAIGPGLGQSSSAGSLVRCVLQNAAVPVVADADALNYLAKHPELLRGPHTEMIVTPHIGEMSRLTGNPISYVKDHRLSVCEGFAREYQVVCVLKDATTVVAAPYEVSYVNTSGSAGMATAGSGDVLTGILAALIAMGLSVSEGVPLGVYLHGLAGEKAVKETGVHSMLASDLIKGIKMIYKERGL